MESTSEFLASKTARQEHALAPTIEAKQIQLMLDDHRDLSANGRELFSPEEREVMEEKGKLSVGQQMMLAAAKERWWKAHKANAEADGLSKEA
jgi:hypothetical protein